MSEWHRRPALFPLRGLSDSERELLYDNAPTKPSAVSLIAVATASVFLERDKLNDERKDLNASSVANFQAAKTSPSTMNTRATATSSSFHNADGGVDSLRERFLDAVNLDETGDRPFRNQAGNQQMASSTVGSLNATRHAGHQEQASSAYQMPSPHVQYVHRGGGLAGRPPQSSHRGGKVNNNARLFH